MARTTANAPPPDDRLMYDLVLSHWQLPALAGACRTGLVEGLRDDPCTAAELAASCGTDPTATASVLELLAAVGLLVRSGTHYALSAVARRYLLPDSADHWGPMLRLVWNEQCAAVRDALTEGAASGYRGRSLWATHDLAPRQAELFAQAMHSHSTAPAAVLAQQWRGLDLSVEAHVLDVGGGTGTFAIELARRYPALVVTILELEAVGALAVRAVAEAGLQDRVAVVTGDMFQDRWPAADTVLFADVLHNWPLPRCRTLLDRAVDALGPGGQVVVHEMLLDDAAPGPTTAAANAVAMAATTGGHQFTVAELAAALQYAGLRGVRSEPAFGYFSVTTAHRQNRNEETRDLA